MRAKHHDLVVEGGATLGTLVRFYRPGPVVEAGAVDDTTFVYYSGTPWPVHSAAPSGSNVVLVLGDGLWWQPTLVLASTALIVTAVPQTFDAVACKYRDAYGTRHDVPTAKLDATTLVLVPDEQTSIDWSLDLQAAIEADELPAPPVDSGYVADRPRFTYAYDLVCTFDGLDGAWRILQGTLTVIPSTAVALPVSVL